ncbi:hypothetical protein [Vagococcus carniphilus]
MTRQQALSWALSELPNYQTSRSRAEHLAKQQQDAVERLKQKNKPLINIK